MYNNIMAEKQEVYIDSIIYWLKIVNLLVPLRIRNWLQHILVGAGMEHFVGRQNDFIKSTSPTKWRTHFNIWRINLKFTK